MSITGQLGTSTSELGSIELGLGSSGNSYTASVSDTVAVSDTLSTKSTDVLGVSSTVGVSDVIAAHSVEENSVSDTVTISDSLHGVFNVHPLLSDTVAESEAVAFLSSGHCGTSDTVSVSDQTGENSELSTSLSDTISVSDQTSSHQSEVSPGSDTVSVSDLAAQHYTITKALSDTIVVSDSLSNHFSLRASVSDTLIVSDLLTPSNSTYSESISDTVSIADQTSGLTRAETPLSDTVTVSDQRTSHVSISFNESDTVAVSDFNTLRSNKFSSNPSTVNVTDSVGLLRALQATAISSVAVSNTVALVLAKHVQVSDTVSLSDSVQATSNVIHIFISDTVSVSELLAPVRRIGVGVSDTTPIHDASYIGAHFEFSEVVSITDALIASSGVVSNQNSLSVTSLIGLRVDGISDLRNYSIEALDGFPVGIMSVSTALTTLGSGSFASVLESHTVRMPGAGLTEGSVGSYVSLQSPSNSSLVRITSVIDSQTASVDQIVVEDHLNGSIHWSNIAPIKQLLFQIDKPTNGALYRFSMSGLTDYTGAPYAIEELFVAISFRPNVTETQVLPDGQVIVTFSDTMLVDDFLADPREYSITGPSTVDILSVKPISTNQVFLETSGLGDGSYLLTVNAMGTPHDIAGNPINPTFNTSIFTSSPTLNSRSIFTDRGPIGKPPLVLATGSNATIIGSSTVSCAGQSFSSGLIGLYINLESTVNGGTYRVVSVPSPTVLTLLASFNLVDPQSGAIVFEVFDPRNGQIADDPTDVSVTINGNPIIPSAVVGLLGQVVLPTVPASTDSVLIDYSWVLNPTVDFRRLNSKEFVLNNWNRSNSSNPANQHSYRYNNTLVVPDAYVPLDIQATLAQPELRNVFYEAYERAYTALLNDPNTLLLNSPIHKIAFPPLERILPQVSVQYNATGLPENQPVTPWTRYSTTTGTASIVNSELVVQSTGSPIYWTQPVDLTFPLVFASTWRLEINSTPTLDGVFTGVSVGWSNSSKAVILGYLNVGGVSQVGFLTLGNGNKVSYLSSWAGGFDGSGNPTNAPFVLDTTVQHSYRIFRGSDSTIRLYVDGSVVESLRVTEAELPYLSELDDTFEALQSVFFGSLSRVASSTSTWDFYRYEVLPIDAEQNTPAIFVSFEGNTTPELSPNPWTPIGYHGTETILGGDFLLLDSTSVTSETDQGIIGGDFRGYAQLEPLLSVASNVDIDFRMQVRTFTNGISPNSVMVAVDDGSLLMQVSFIDNPVIPISKASYPGRLLPTLIAPTVWESIGGVIPVMIGQTLRINDATSSDGLVYSTIPTFTDDYIFESRLNINGYTPDSSGFAGAFVSEFDSVRSVGIMFQDVAGIRYVTFHTDGTVVQQNAFEWRDTGFHTYRVVRNLNGNLVTLFVDGVLLANVPYSSFGVGVGGSSQLLSFGSSTPLSMSALSSVDWIYVNTWQPAPSSTPKYVGLWKGHDSTSLLGYHLPTKVLNNHGASVDSLGIHIIDLSAPFVSSGVIGGDMFIVDDGPNRGVYPINTVISPTEIQLLSPLPAGPSVIDYRIPTITDWTYYHSYRLLRDTNGKVSVFLDSAPVPIILVDYSSTMLPMSTLGIPDTVSNGLPSISFGAFDPMNLSQTSWDYVRYGITNSVGGARIVPSHMFLNQRNVIASPEHLTTTIPHTHTDYWSSSTGIPPQSFFDTAGLNAFTQLNEGTPIVPQTQSYEVNTPTPVQVFLASLNTPQDVLNNSGTFLLNDGSTQVRLVVPDNVLYSSLKITEVDTGDIGLLYPISDEDLFQLGTLSFQNTVCLQYSGEVIPELDPTAITPWHLVSTDSTQVHSSAFSGILTYSTGSTGSATIYRNYTPLPDAIGMETQVTFNLKVVTDSTGGTGDSGIRFGFSAIGLTAALAFVTTSVGDRLVQLIDLNNDSVVGALQFDYLDGNFHEYRLVKDTTGELLNFYIDF